MTTDTNGWIRVEDRLPEEEDADEYGNVLVFREMNSGQKKMSKSIIDYKMIRLCEAGSYWHLLPKNPQSNPSPL